MQTSIFKNSLAVVLLLSVIISCQSNKKEASSGKSFSVSQLKTGRQATITADTPTMLIDKDIPEIKEYVNGVWELIKGKNNIEEGEFENTYITFDDNRYVWTENGESETGDLNWRKTATGIGYDACLMDVFYAESPSFPIAIHKDTLFIQDCTETGYLYTLIRR